MIFYIFEHLWLTSCQILVFSALVLLICYFSNKNSAKFRYWLWFVILLRLFIPDVAISNSINQVFPENSLSIFPETFRADIQEKINDNLSKEEEEKFLFFSDKTQKAQKSRENSIIYIWLIIVLILITLVITRVITKMKAIYSCSLCQREDLNELLNHYCQKMRISKPIRILSSKNQFVDSPCVVGILSPRIILPDYIIQEWSLSKLTPVVLHELAHIKRKDLLIVWLQSIAQLIYFFHPLVWYINQKISQEREFICDDLAIEYFDNRCKDYARILIEFTSLRQRKIFLTSLTLSFSQKKSFLQRRVVRIMNIDYIVSRKMNKTHFLLLGFIISSICLFADEGNSDLKQDKKVKVLEERVKKLEEQVTRYAVRNQKISEQQFKAKERMRQDLLLYSAEKLQEIENLYQKANQNRRNEQANGNLKQLLKKYTKSNRAGCAILYLAQMSQGKKREEYLLKAIENYNDCYYGDGVQVGAYAKYILALYYKKTFEKKKGDRLFRDIKNKHPYAIDHHKQFLCDLIE
ncbi:M56 family metallopeptidase [Candidatus Uabimicrobium sp. HlEnr_7]|uniref:M56 family metallopeptidase n=1 Tax=Candidatus Uabimicrobium helgolandensis TaxID=3095367 RepID=UPI0035566906